jgi:tricarballylate dehydrogenase
LKGIDHEKALNTLIDYNKAVNKAVASDPTIKDGKNTEGLIFNKRAEQVEKL